MLLFLRFHAVIFIIPGIWVLIKNTSAVMVSFVAKFTIIIVVLNAIIWYSLFAKTIK